MTIPIKLLTARTTFGVNGSGLKIGVLSDSVDYLSSSQIAGLVTVLSDKVALRRQAKALPCLKSSMIWPPEHSYFCYRDRVVRPVLRITFSNFKPQACNIIVDDEFVL